MSRWRRQDAHSPTNGNKEVLTNGVSITMAIATMRRAGTPILTAMHGGITTAVGTGRSHATTKEW